MLFHTIQQYVNKSIYILFKSLVCLSLFLGSYSLSIPLSMYFISYIISNAIISSLCSEILIQPNQYCVSQGKKKFNFIPFKSIIQDRLSLIISIFRNVTVFLLFNATKHEWAFSFLFHFQNHRTLRKIAEN